MTLVLAQGASPGKGRVSLAGGVAALRAEGAGSIFPSPRAAPKEVQRAQRLPSPTPSPRGRGVSTHTLTLSLAGRGVPR